MHRNQRARHESGNRRNVKNQVALMPRTLPEKQLCQLGHRIDMQVHHLSLFYVAYLAHYLGMRPESLSRAMHELQDMGIVKLHKADAVEIVDLEALVETSGENLLFEDDF